ncbi:hypothetical protein [Frankia gtarii]|uniref:hypothetical protein n=1 Tax=Frankia gtarii TaxID=2950102 RepID=UPI0021C1F9A2|nr:hypothetical protein [Frankia gtarii]
MEIGSALAGAAIGVLIVLAVVGIPAPRAVMVTPVVATANSIPTAEPGGTPTVVVVPAPASHTSDTSAGNGMVPIVIAALAALPGTLTALAGLVLVLRNRPPVIPPAPPLPEGPPES